jgi:prepilin-type N-terminal cleavage/methylation domain-containing protein
MRHKGNNCLTYLPFKRRGGFSLIELIIVIAIIIIFSAISMPYLRDFISSQRLQEVSWQIVQDLKSVKEDAILYQQDLNIYINYNNLPVEPMNAANKNNRSYLFETFQWGQDQTVQVKDQHYIPTDAINSHFTERVLKYNIIIDSITSGTPSSIQIPIGKNYFVICFRSGAGSTFRGEGDVVTSMSGRTNSTPSIIDSSKLVIKLKDTSSNKAFYVIVDGTGEISMNGSPP